MLYINNEYTTPKLFIYGIFFAYISRGWLFVTIILYFNSLCLFRKVNEYFYTQTTNLRPYIGLQELRKKWTQIIGFRNRFSNLFSFIPFVWFSSTFIHMSLAIVIAVASKLEYSVIYGFEDFILFESPFIFVLEIIFCLDYFNKRTNEMSNNLIEYLTTLNSKCKVEKFAIMSEILEKSAHLNRLGCL
jgi:hypothetical protein